MLMWAMHSRAAVGVRFVEDGRGREDEPFVACVGRAQKIIAADLVSKGGVSQYGLGVPRDRTPSTCSTLALCPCRSKQPHCAFAETRR